MWQSKEGVRSKFMALAYFWRNDSFWLHQDVQTIHVVSISCNQMYVSREWMISVLIWFDDYLSEPGYMGDFGGFGIKKLEYSWHSNHFHSICPWTTLRSQCWGSPFSIACNTFATSGTQSPRSKISHDFSFPQVCVTGGLQGVTGCFGSPVTNIFGWTARIFFINDEFHAISPREIILRISSQTRATSSSLSDFLLYRNNILEKIIWITLIEFPHLCFWY